MPSTSTPTLTWTRNSSRTRNRNRTRSHSRGLYPALNVGWMFISMRQFSTDFSGTQSSSIPNPHFAIHFQFILPNIDMLLGIALARMLGSFASESEKGKRSPGAVCAPRTIVRHLV